MISPITWMPDALFVVKTLCVIQWVFIHQCANEFGEQRTSRTGLHSRARPPFLR